MNARWHWCTGGLLALLWAGLASAQAPAVPAPVASALASTGGRDDTAEERERIRKARGAIEDTLQRAQAACYQRFAVEDCLRAARRQAREAQAVLRQQETAMDDRERRERAAQRLKSIEERQSTRAADAPPVIGRGAPQPPATRQRAQPKPQARPPDAIAARQEERRLALQQRAEVERQRQAQKRQAALERKERLQQRQAQDAARGRQPAAPLVP